jgi:flagellar basal-body rod modification protein FlgD
MQSVLANYTMPTVLNSLSPAAGLAQAKPAAAKANATSSTGTSGSTSSSTSAGNLGTTFLSLLAQELQNQDPTAPVDPTAMVGQMISLNSLEQLIGINQAISGATSSGSTATGQSQPASATADSTAATTASSTAASAVNGGLASLLSPSVAGAATTQLPFDPKTMMPLGYGNFGAVAASINPSLNTVNMGLSGTNNNMAGGK